MKPRHRAGKTFDIAIGAIALLLGAALLLAGAGGMLWALIGGEPLARAFALVGLMCSVPLLVGGFRLLRRSLRPEAEGAVDTSPAARESPSGGALSWRSALAIVAVVVGLPFALIFWFKSANQDLIDLAPVRLNDLAALRPAVLKYHQDKGAYPVRLGDLVPDYVPGIPASLVNADGMENVQKLSYGGDRQGAKARFHAHRGPDSSIEYDFVSGRVMRNE